MKKLNNLLLIAMLMLMSAGAWAQGAIMGTVTDNNGEALVGVSIGAAGTGKSTRFHCPMVPTGSILCTPVTSQFPER
jgi:hypothetical protein